jgi:hypothetical protein
MWFDGAKLNSRPKSVNPKGLIGCSLLNRQEELLDVRILEKPFSKRIKGD